MTQDQQFWWNWYLNLAVAIGTLGAVILALFGDRLRFKPRLKINLLRKEGERTQLTHTESGEVLDEVWFYHFRVRNNRRWCPADNVQVYLTRLDERGPNGNLEVGWLGNVPMRWRDQEIVEIRQTIGGARDCDLCRVGKQSGLCLMPLIMPNSLQKFAVRKEKRNFVIWLQAIANQIDSDIVRIEISWNGSWDDNETAMQQHLVIREISATRSR